MLIKVNNVRGFSLLELLLVVSLMMVLMSFAIPPFQSHQQDMQTRLAWIYMQQIALSQTEYYMTQQVYARDLSKLTLTPPQDTGYRYSVAVKDNYYTIHGNLIQGPRPAGVCTHLQLDSQGQKQAFDQSGQIITRCLYDQSIL